MSSACLYSLILLWTYYWSGVNIGNLHNTLQCLPFTRGDNNMLSNENILWLSLYVVCTMSHLNSHKVLLKKLWRDILPYWAFYGNSHLKRFGNKYIWSGMMLQKLALLTKSEGSNPFFKSNTNFSTIKRRRTFICASRKMSSIVQVSNYSSRSHVVGLLSLANLVAFTNQCCGALIRMLGKSSWRVALSWRRHPYCLHSLLSTWRFRVHIQPQSPYVNCA